MGTLVTNYYDKKALVKELIAGTLEHSCVGNVLYTLHADSYGGKYIGVALLSQHSGRWAYKTMDESMYPYYFTCPKKLLDKSTCTSELAVKWRSVCRAKSEAEAERKSFIKTLAYGDSIMYHGKRYTYFGVSAYKGSIRAVGEDGVIYRLLTKYVESGKENA